MADSYTTKSGEQWDGIAKTVYGSEIYTDWLMQNNYPLLDTYQFDAGIVLRTPALPAGADGSLPPWRQ